ncbi:MAG: hypothetical protein Q8936_01295 [Bacillota bacterium]|nr:hypothetical protein [Bacillota bacterium]
MKLQKKKIKLKPHYLGFLVIIIIISICYNILARNFISTSILDSIESDQKKTEETFSKFKEHYVKWTGYVRLVYRTPDGDSSNNSKYTLEFGTKNNSTIEARFNSILDEKNFPVGSIVTISGVVTSNLFRCNWELDNCKIEDTSGDDKKLLSEYCNKVDKILATSEVKETSSVQSPTSQQIDTSDDEKPDTTIPNGDPNKDGYDFSTNPWVNHTLKGHVGYIVVTQNNLSDLSEYEKKFPSEPWKVPVEKQIGDHTWEKINDSILDKTKVKVLDTKDVTAHDGGLMGSDGAMLVETLDSQKRQVWINPYNFVLKEDYNQIDLKTALLTHPVMTIYNGKGSKVSTADGKWVDIPSNTKVIAFNYDDKYLNKVHAFVYKNWEYGYGGIECLFDLNSLDIVN